MPKCRVNGYLPFITVGVDYEGPFSIKDRKEHGAKVSKTYICLLVCLNGKAVHLEIGGEYLLTYEDFYTVSTQIEVF